MWHTKCRAKYTNRKTVDKKSTTFAKQEGTSSKAGPSTETDSSAPKTRFSVTRPIKYKEECFICGTRTTKGHRSLLLISTYDRQNSIWEKGNQLEDEDMLRKIRGPDLNKCTDMIANDFRYHKNCMFVYLTRRVHTQEKTSTDTIPYDTGLTQPVSRIDGPLFKDGAVFFITVLRDEFRKYLANHGVDNAISYRSQSLVTRLKRYYEVDGNCKIMVVPQKGCSCLVCSAELSIGCMLTKLKELKETAQEADYEEEGDDNS